jgi:glycosyltransferase involved in cell wall biosynthesis/LmbE family N-acetylglucosaminyl deacetylase
VRIAFLAQPVGTYRVPPSASQQIWIYEVADRLARLSQGDVVVYSRRARGQPREEVDGRITYRRFSGRLDRFALKWLERIAPARRSKLPLFASPLYYPKYVMQVAADARRRKCDVIHIQNFSQFVPIVRALNPHIKIVLDMRSEWLSQLDEETTRHRIAKTDLVIGCSDHITGAIRERFPEFADRCVTVYPGVDVDAFRPLGRHDGTGNDQPQPRLLFVGRVSPEKGVHVLLEAFRMIVDDFPEARLEIVGPHQRADRGFIVDLSDDEGVRDLRAYYDGDYRAYLENRVRHLKIERNVVFSGLVRQRDLIERYQAADVVVNPSFSESFGRSLIEAMASGVPVIGARVGGMKETIDHGETGLVVDPGDAAGLAEATKALLSDDLLRRAMGAAGRERAVKRYSWEKVVEELWSHYTPGSRRPNRPASASGASERLAGSTADDGHGSLRRYSRDGLARVLARQARPSGDTDGHSAMVFAPHPDDEVLGCGGTIAMKRRLGAPVTLVWMTDGRRSHSRFIDPDKLGAARRAEAVASARALGVGEQDIVFLGLPPGASWREGADAVARVGALIEELAPQEVYIPYRGDTHEDHRATRQVVRSALRSCTRPLTVCEYPVWFWRRWPWCRAPADKPLVGRARDMVAALLAVRDLNRAHDVTTLLEAKRVALACHRTQTERMAPGWPILAEIAGGEWLPYFFAGHEYFCSYRSRP